MRSDTGSLPERTSSSSSASPNQAENLAAAASAPETSTVPGGISARMRTSGDQRACEAGVVASRDRRDERSAGLGSERSHVRPAGQAVGAEGARARKEREALSCDVAARLVSAARGYESGSRREANASHVADVRMTPRTRRQPPIPTRGNMNLQRSHRTSGVGAGR